MDRLANMPPAPAAPEPPPAPPPPEASQAPALQVSIEPQVPQLTLEPQLFVLLPQTSPPQVTDFASSTQTHWFEASQVSFGAVVQVPHAIVWPQLLVALPHS